MSLRGIALALLLAPLLAPLVASQPAEPWAPLAVSAAAIQGAGAAVSWLPGSESADSYRVYGIGADGSKTLLEENVTQLSAPVPTGFHAYAVSGVKLGVESDAVTAVESCIEISIQPPDVGLCYAGGGAKIEAETSFIQ